MVLKNHKPIKIPLRKSRAVVNCLAAQIEPVTREQLLSLFWVGTPRASRLQTLRTTLSSLRKNLGDWIEISQDSIQLASETWVDVRQFLENPGPPVQDVYILESVVVAGRAGELKRIRELAGRHQLLLIEGEPGIGKTRMVGEYLKEWKGIKLIGTAQELEKNIPYQPIAEALCSVFEKQLDRT